MTWIASSVLRPRSLNGTPEASNSRGSSTPTPTAGRRRPPESQSIVAISLAATTGVRYGRTITLGPNLSLLVRAATAARVVMTSGTGAGEERRSESQRESMPLRSRNSHSVQRNAPPSRPGGQDRRRDHLSLLQDQGRHPHQGVPREDGGVRLGPVARHRRGAGRGRQGEAPRLHALRDPRAAAGDGRRGAGGAETGAEVLPGPRDPGDRRLLRPHRLVARGGRRRRALQA